MDLTSGVAKSAKADVDASFCASGVVDEVAVQPESDILEVEGGDGDAPSFPNQFASSARRATKPGSGCPPAKVYR